MHSDFLAIMKSDDIKGDLWRIFFWKTIIHFYYNNLYSINLALVYKFYVSLLSYDTKVWNQIPLFSTLYGGLKVSKVNTEYKFDA